jgi:hypothetical protein
MGSIATLFYSMKVVRRQGFRGWVALAALGVAALALAACGSSSSGDEATSALATVPKAQFIKQADAICEKAEQQQRARVALFTERHSGEPEGRSQLIALIRFAGLPPLETQAEELAKLPLPHEETKQAETYLQFLNEALEKAEADPSSMAGSVERSPFLKAEVLARKFGFNACGGA